MKIGNLIFADPFVMLAPLAGYGDIAFRRICRERGASLTVTEMISAKGLVYGNEKTEEMLRTAGCESPSAVQLFGSEPEFFRKALKHPLMAKFDIIDINMGCPVPKVTKCGEGSALMRDEVRAAEIVRACVENGGGRPVTVKHRLGYTSRERNAVRFARAVEDAGAAAITVHGRTAEQGYSGTADWDSIAEVAQAVSVPVIGNGDVRSLGEAEARMRESGCRGVAIGRGAVGNPSVFGEECESVLDTALRHIDYAAEYFPERTAVTTMRKHLVKYLARVKGTKELRSEIFTIESVEKLKEALVASLGSRQSID